MFSTIGYYICLPFAALTRLFYELTGSYGVALILFTLVVKLVLLPFQLKSKKSMLRMNRMQGKVQEIQTRYAKNREKMQMEMSELYAREGVNPMSGCLWSLIPFPILIALYNVIRYPLHYFMSIPVEIVGKIRDAAVALGYSTAASGQASVYEEIYLAKFVHENWGAFDGKFEGLIDLNYQFLGMDLATRPTDVVSNLAHGGWAIWGLMLLPVISAGIQLAMTLVSMRNTAGSAEVKGTSKMMMYLMPLMSLWMGFILPAALCVYWIAQAAFSMVQELVLNKVFNKKLDKEETEKEKAKKQKRLEKYERQKALIEQQRAVAQMPDKHKGQKNHNGQNGQKSHKNSGEKHSATSENGRVGNRPYARGRAYNDKHYGK